MMMGQNVSTAKKKRRWDRTEDTYYIYVCNQFCMRIHVSYIKYDIICMSHALFLRLEPTAKAAFVVYVEHVVAVPAST